MSKFPMPGATDEQHQVGQLIMNESDRGAILVGGALLDELLGEVIAANLDASWTKAVFQADGPAGTFSRKISLAGGLGLVDPDVAKALDVVRTIRNSASHFDRRTGAGFVVDFNSRHVVDSLKTCPLVPHYSAAKGRPDLAPARIQWVFLVMELASHLRSMTYFGGLAKKQRDEQLEKRGPTRCIIDEAMRSYEASEAQLSEPDKGG